ncbi:hypothetical protein D3C76_1005890 [compost metagenome]
MIEQHADRTHQQPARCRDIDTGIAEPDQAVIGEVLQLRPDAGEIGVEVDIEGLFDRGEIQLEVADQLLDHRAADTVVRAAVQAAAGRELVVVQAVLVIGDVVAVLGIEVADLADGGYAKTDEVAMSVGGVALEVALQRAIFLGAGQFVIRQGEMVHADVAITRRGQLLGGALEHFQLLCGAGQFQCVDPPLRHEAFRQVGIVEHR